MEEEEDQRVCKFRKKFTNKTPVDERKKARMKELRDSDACDCQNHEFVVRKRTRRPSA